MKNAIASTNQDGRILEINGEIFEIFKRVNEQFLLENNLKELPQDDIDEIIRLIQNEIELDVMITHNVTHVMCSEISEKLLTIKKYSKLIS